MRILLAAAAAVAAGACTDPSPQPQPNEMERVINATQVDPGVVTNEDVNFTQGSITPGEREPIRQVESQSPAQVVGQFANLLVRRQFEEAYRMWDPQAADFTPEQFARVFNSFETIAAEIGQTTSAGAAASAEEVQLTLSGTTTAGENYVVTGPVTVTRADGQRQGWRIAKVILTANPRAAEALVEPQGKQ